MNSERIIDIVEDHALICSFLDQVSCSIENGVDMPNFVPVLNDSLVSDQLGRIAEELKKMKV